MRHAVFFIAYLYFLYNDFKDRKISIIALGIYGFFSFLVMIMAKDNLSMNKFIDIMFSVFFGLVIYILSYFSGEGIGIADGTYFVINGLLLTLKENIILFLSGIMVAFIIGIAIYIFSKNKNKRKLRLPLMPCFLPAIIGYILCIV